MQLSPDSHSYKILQRAFFPVGIILLPYLVHVLISNGVHFLVATYSVLVSAGLIFLLMEHLMPYREKWNQPAGDLANDFASGIVSYVLIPKFIKPLYITALAGIAAWLAVQVGQDIWPTDWPLWAQVVLLLLAGDAGRYWGHRLAHQVPLLWRFHAVHHSASRLWFWNATRQHPVDRLWFMATEIIVPVLMGVTGEVLSLYLAVTAMCGFAQHCNINLKLGPLYYLFNVVELHRWHHSKLAEESDHNYGNNLIVYDRLFGTYYHPEQQHNNPSRTEVGDIGLLNPHYPQNYLGQLTAPFRKGKLDKQQPPATAPNKA